MLRCAAYAMTASDVDARDYVLRACYGHLKARGVVGDGDKARENRKVVRPLVFDGDSLLLVPPYGSIQCAVFGELVDDEASAKRSSYFVECAEAPEGAPPARLEVAPSPLAKLNCTAFACNYAQPHRWPGGRAVCWFIICVLFIA